jgi:hypothetical protein
MSSTPFKMDLQFHKYWISSVKMNTSDINALRETHATAIAAFNKIFRLSSGITKIQKSYRTSTLAAMLRDGRAIRWLLNRKEVQARSGSAAMYMQSLACKASTGMFVCYWNGEVTLDAKGKPTFEPTVANPIVIYEGGHRSRWLDEIYNNTTQVAPGITLEILRILNPEAAAAMESAPVILNINTHESGEVPIEYVKWEYATINCTVEAFSAGETVAASRDEVRNELDALVVAALRKRHVTPKKREGNKVIVRAMTNGALGKAFDQRAESLQDASELKPEQIESAKTNIALFASMEEKIEVLCAGNPETKKRFRKRIYLFRQDATLMNAIVTAPTRSLKEAVVEDIVKFHEMFFLDEAAWKEAEKVFGGGAGNHSTSAVFADRWVKIQNLVHPAPAPTEEVELEMADTT